jgi:hypothetical protein
MVPTLKENIILMPYFKKKGILNGFRACDLAAWQIAQKKDNLSSIPDPGPVRCPLWPKINGFPEEEKDGLF